MEHEARVRERERTLAARERELGEQRRVLAEEYQLLRRPAGGSGFSRTLPSAARPTLPPRAPMLREGFWSRLRRLLVGLPEPVVSDRVSS